MPNALSKSTNANKYISQVVSLAPCFVPSPSFIAGGLNFTPNQYGLLKSFLTTSPIHTLFGDTWNLDMMMLCMFDFINPTLKIMCDYFRGMELYSPATP